MADTERLESLLDSLSEAIKKMLPAENLEEFRMTIRRPGWTTPAEFLFLEASLTAITEQAAALGNMQRSLLQACKAVE